ncbi:MAG: hypothetical protein ACH349_01450 [Candidatus Rhabdochlamydia sp.]
MTFNAAVPLNGDSPATFPAQNQTNMARLQTLLGADHQFNLSAAADDGYHNVVHLTQQAPSGALAATGRLYVKSAGGAICLFYMDDAGLEYQITPVSLAPTKVTGSVALAGSAISGTVYTIPDNSQGTIFVNYIVPAGNFYNYYLFYKSGSVLVDTNILDSSSNSNRPEISISGSNIRVVNGNTSASTVGYYIMVESI